MTKITELFFLMMMAVLLFVLLTEYFYPQLVPSVLYDIKNKVISTLDYWRYRGELYLQKDEFPHKDEFSPPLENSKNASSVPVFLYHGITRFGYKNDVPLSNFKDQMFALKKNGYNTITLSDFHAFIKGEKQLPDKSVLITFDDGVKTSYYNTDPVLKALGYTAVMYIITTHSISESKHPYYLDLKEIQEMADSGRWEIQGHAKEGHFPILIDSNGTLGHFFTNKMWLRGESRLETNEEFRERIKEDLVGAKEDIESALGNEVYSFAFPFGDMGEESANFPKAKSYLIEETARTYSLIMHQHWPSKGYTYNPPEGNSFVTRRRVSQKWDGRDLIEALKDGEDKQLPFYDNFEENSGWISVWGNLKIDNSMILNPVVISEDYQGNSLFLDGSYPFTDYLFTADINSTSAELLSLKARYQNELNFVSCDFYKDKVKIREIVDGDLATLAETKTEFKLPKKEFELAVKVEGEKIGCLFGNALLVQAKLHHLIPKGGIGFKVLDYGAENNDAGNAIENDAVNGTTIIQKISVVEIN